jgi:CxxC motif-containing protein (DUF1111 family)
MSRLNRVLWSAGATICCAIFPLTAEVCGDDPADTTEPVADSAVIGGRELFEREWVADDKRANGGDGLGPMFNDVSCKACHNAGGVGGAGPNEKNVILLSVPAPLAPSKPIPSESLEFVHPGLRNRLSVMLHRHSTSPAYADWFLQRYPARNWPKETVSLDAADDSEVQRRMLRKMLQTRRGAITQSLSIHGKLLSVTERNATALFGAGLLEEVPGRVIEAAAKRTWEKWPTVQGRALRQSDGSVGRFGWKGQETSLKEFIQVACAAELGLQVPRVNQGIDVMAVAMEPPTEEAAPPAQSPKEYERYQREAKAKEAAARKREAAARQRAKLDLTEMEVDALVDFVAKLPRPTTRRPYLSAGENSVENGRKLFEQVGCASCHLPQLGTLEGAYTDLLVHKMGSQLNDSAEYYGQQQRNPTQTGKPNQKGNSQQAAADEWRTPPLWGVRDSAPYLHDGRAETIEQAIAFHEGSADASSLAYFDLSRDDRRKILSFLSSLVAPEETKE